AQGLSLVCHSRGGLGEATFVLGPPAGIAAILSIHPGAYQTFATAKPEHLEALKSVYRLSGTRVMRRLHVKRQRFEAVEGTATRLRGAHVRTLNRLYSSEGGLTAYQAHHIDEGCYYGVVEEGRLVAVAGTHAISPTHGIAVVGNVFTHPLYRGRGHATVATSAVTAALLESQRDVVLSVDPGNTPAIQAYNLLGYEDCGEIVEAAGRRRASGLVSGLRRLRAAIRGHKDGAEIVRIASH
ncbi:MAG: GNAT family N-acetyltransferase, partial [Dehalococcoidia bacterium]